MTTEALQNLKSLKTFLQPKGSEQTGDVAKNKATFSNHLHANKAVVEQGRRLQEQDIDPSSDRSLPKDVSRDDKISRHQKRREQEQHQTDKASADHQNEPHVEDSKQRAEDVEARDKDHSKDQDNKTAQEEALENQDTLEQAQETSQQDGLQDNEEQRLTASPDELNLEVPSFIDGAEDPFAASLQEMAERLAVVQDQRGQQGALQGAAIKSDGPAGLNEAPEVAAKQGALSLDPKGGGKGGLLGQGTELESTLGQDADGEVSTNKANVIEKGNGDISKSFAQILTNKDPSGSTLTQQPAGPILASNPLSSSPLTKTNTFQPLRQDAGVIQSGDGTNSSLALQTQETKAASPTNTLRSAGYTSPTQSIALSIAQKAQNGIQQFEIRLNPPELGRVDVRLEFGREGAVTTHLIVERPETLEMLNKDGRQLERALADAGVTIENDGLSFSLKDQQEGKEEQENPLGSDLENQSGLDDSSDDQSPTPAYQRITLPGGLDIRI